MRSTLAAVTFLALAAAGCGPQWEVRRLAGAVPDDWKRLSARTTRGAEPGPATDPGYDVTATAHAAYESDDGRYEVRVVATADPADAYGLYSWDRHGENPGVGTLSSMSGGTLSFWKGKYFVTVSGRGPEELIKAAVLDAGRRIADAIPGAAPEPALVAALPEDARAAARYFHKSAELRRVWNFSELVEGNPLGLGAGTKAVAGRRGDGPVHLVVLYPISPPGGAVEAVTRAFPKAAALAEGRLFAIVAGADKSENAAKLCEGTLQRAKTATAQAP